MYDIKKLRSLVVDELSIQDSSNSGLIYFIQCVLEESKQLRALIFYNLPFHISLEAIGDLIHLRYLEIGFWAKLNLPVCKLYHLQVLNKSIFLPSCLLLKDVNNCINLRHLNKGLFDFSEVHGLSKLTCLQELVDYYVGEEYGHEIGQLRNMRQLRGSLSIHNLDYVKTKEAASEAMLHNKEHLKFLGLRWNYYAEDLKADVCEEIIEELRPHINLKELKIDGYMGIRSPSWLSKTWLSKLEFILLELCNAWEVLPPLGQLPFLKFLYLEGMSAVKKVGTEFYGSDDTAFPTLEELKFEHMTEWEEWSGPEKGQLLFPHLQRLGIYGCRKLRRTLVLPTSSKEVRLVWWGHGCSKIILDDAPSSSMLEICIDYDSQQFFWGLSKEVLASIQYLSFDGHNHITSFTEKEEEWFQNLTSLKELIFIRCMNLQSFPASMKSLSSLKKLKAKQCPNIDRLPEKGLPTSLEKLHIIGTCKEELEMRCQMSDGQDWPKISHIPRIVIGGIEVRWPEYE